METYRNTIVKGHQKTAGYAALGQQGLRVAFVTESRQTKNHAFRAVFADSTKHGKGLGIPKTSISNKTKMSSHAKRKAFANLLFAIAVDQGRERKQNHSESRNSQNEIDQKSVAHNLLAFVALNQGRQCEQYENQAQNGQYKESQKSVGHEIYFPFNKLRQMAQNTNAAIEPITAYHRLNFSKTEGKTTAATAINPKSAAMSDSLPICDSENFGSLIASSITGLDILSIAD